MLGFLAFLLTSTGAACFYLGSPNQTWRRKPLDSGLIVPAAAVLLVLGMGMWGLAMRPVTGFFVFLTLLMLLWVIFPFIGALRRSRQ